MKNYFLVAATCAGFVIAGCNNSGDTGSAHKDSTNTIIDTSLNKDTTNVMDSANKKMDSSSSTNASSSSTDFVNKAATGGMTEVELGKLAQKNGGSDEVKKYGKMLEKDHTAANNKLKEIAGRENLSVPSSMMPEQMQHLNHLQMLQGKEFDNVFIPMMIEDHTKDISEFKNAAANNENAKLKAFATATLPTLEKHLAKAKSININMH